MALYPKTSREGGLMIPMCYLAIYIKDNYTERIDMWNLQPPQVGAIATRELIKGDTEIQSFAAELVKERNRSTGGVGIKGVPGNGEVTCSEDLVLILTCIIYTCSISHASTNFPQCEEYAFPPNYSSLMRGKPPSSKDTDITEKDILSSLPDKLTTLDIMIVTKILSAKGTKSIGDFEVQYMFDPQAREIVDQFRRDLKEISKKIKARNQHRNPPYQYLDPEIIPNSISI